MRQDGAGDSRAGRPTHLQQHGLLRPGLCRYGFRWDVVPADQHHGDDGKHHDGEREGPGKQASALLPALSSALCAPAQTFGHGEAK